VDTASCPCSGAREAAFAALTAWSEEVSNWGVFVIKQLPFGSCYCAIVQTIAFEWKQAAYKRTPPRDGLGVFLAWGAECFEKVFFFSDER